MEFFAPTEDEMLAEAKLPGVFGKRAAINEFGAGFRERALAKRGEILVELASENELKHSVTEEFEALVGLDRNALFMGDGWVSQSEPEEGSVVEGVTEKVLEIVVV